MKEETERKEEGRQFVLSDVPTKRTRRKKYFEVATKKVNAFLRFQEKKKKEVISYAI